MFTVKTEIRRSKIHGLGVFALEPIRKGQVVVQLIEENCYTEDDLNNLPKILVDYIKHYSYKEGNQYRLPIDNSRYLNDDRGDIPANIGVPSNGMGEIALRDIAIGEELVSDYIRY